MKINTSWSQEDWNKALKKVWQLSRNFEEILEFGLENGFITNADIIHASDIYHDPNKEYDEDDIDDFVKSVSLSDLMKSIKDEYSLSDIIFELPTHELLEYFDKSDLLEELEDSWELDQHDEEVREETYKDYVDEWIEEMKAQDKEYIKILYNANSDNFHEFLCDTLGCGYYDQSVVNKLKEKLKNNSFGVDYEK